MKRSLQRHLSVMLGSVIVIIGILAAATSFTLAYFEAKEFQDDLLKQIASLQSVYLVQNHTIDAQQPSPIELDINDPESRILIIHLPTDQRPDWLSEFTQPGLHTINSDTEWLRVFIRDTPTSGRTIVAQPTEVRNEIAIDSALHTLIPMLFLTPLLIILVLRIIKNELSPINQLSKDLDKRPIDRNLSIEDKDLPIEITPFIHAINRLLERVHNLVDQQRRFVADAAHELRSPLTALSLQAKNLCQSSSLDVMRERVQPLQAGIERAQKLTGQLLNLARTQAGGTEGYRINISTMARELISEYLPLAEMKEIDLGLEEISPLSMSIPDEPLRLVIKNALENALKYTTKGGIVTLRLFGDNLGVIIEVIDNGPGIPFGERERVFDAFYRLPGTTEEGNGLGLAIAKEAAIRLGGSISLHERPDGNGLIFRYRQ